MGSGMTLTFWLPLLFKTDGIQLIISPLNILGEQNVTQLAEMDIKGISITSETATYQNFQVCRLSLLLTESIDATRDTRYRT